MDEDTIYEKCSGCDGKGAIKGSGGLWWMCPECGTDGYVEHNCSVVSEEDA